MVTPAQDSGGSWLLQWLALLVTPTLCHQGQSPLVTLCCLGGQGIKTQWSILTCSLSCSQFKAALLYVMGTLARVFLWTMWSRHYGERHHCLGHWK